MQMQFPQIDVTFELDEEAEQLWAEAGLTPEAAAKDKRIEEAVHRFVMANGHCYGRYSVVVNNEGLRVLGVGEPIGEYIASGNVGHSGSIGQA